MYSHTLYNEAVLRDQINRQKKHAWDLEKNIDWELGVETDKYLLPIDKDAIAFPGASEEQKLALSQLLGLIINATISEMEDVITKLRDSAWIQVLKSYPVNPEMWELGELFFEEERKHSYAFARYNLFFSETMGIDPEKLDLIIPKAYGSLFLKAVTANAKSGGNAFWWVVASVEEVSIELYKHLHVHRDKIDPLFHEVHLRHMEEESRHHNYAFLMLEVINQRQSTIMQKLHKKFDLVFAQVFQTGWVLGELHKVLNAAKFKKDHPFFEVIASCKPLFEKLSTIELAEKLFISAPYISLVLNNRFHKKTALTARQQQAFIIPFPKPNLVPTASSNDDKFILPKKTLL